MVTGASSGIGAAIAKELASRGHAVTLVARREERLRSLATELAADHGVDAEVIACDLGEDDRARPARRPSYATGAGWSRCWSTTPASGTRPTSRGSPRERMVEMVRINVEAVVDLTSRFLTGMVDRGRGSVINIASTAAFQPLPGSAVYAASKSFVLSFSEAIRTELRGSGVTVTAVCPGPVRTEFTEVAGFEQGVEDRRRRSSGCRPRTSRVTRSTAPSTIAGSWSRARSIAPPRLAGQHSPRAVALPLISRFWRNV